MKYLLSTGWIVAMIIGISLCVYANSDSEVAVCKSDSQRYNSIYHWRTTFDVDSTEVAFIKQHNISRIYLRMFDVALEQNLDGISEIVPIATTKFVSEIPAGVEVVPVTYITLDALKQMSGEEEDYAMLIVERLLAMASYNKCGTIKEMQLDCDWTKSTKGSYDRLCSLVKSRLEQEGIKLSATIRLHQLQETPPPVDCGVLMLYNTGALKNPKTHNSILSIDDVKPYLKVKKYPLPLDYAFPTFEWWVRFENGRFSRIMTTEEETSSGNVYVRHERPTVTEILEVKQLVEDRLGKPANGNILYHLDKAQLKNYTEDEIAKILSF